MIDFVNGKTIKLSQVKTTEYDKLLSPLFASGESSIAAFQTVRDGVVFTNKRIFAINIQGAIGKKKSIASLPYSKIQAFQIETSGVFDVDGELALWFANLGKVHFEFSGNSNLTEICRIISAYSL